MKKTKINRRDAEVAEKAPEKTISALSAPLRWEIICLVLIVAFGAWLRLSHLDLLEFQGDEAYAAQLALDFVQHGKLPQAGLMSSVGVTNPPLFIYLLIPMFAINASPVFVSCCIAVLSLAAVVVCWHIGRKYYGAIAGLTASAMFAVSPWAVIYSRKIWAQDFVPIFATATMWAVHALVLGKKPKAIFWAVLLPLCVVQIHFSGLALTAAVLAILVWLRPKIDWRFGVAGLAAALIVMAPYLKLQSDHGWADFKQAAHAVGGGQQWEQLRGMTIHPVTGYRLPSRAHGSYALAIMNGSAIEDTLGIAADKKFDQSQVWTHKAGAPRPYFVESLTLGGWLLLAQRCAFLPAIIWLLVLAIRAVRWPRVEGEPGQAAWILVFWLAVPLAVFGVTGLWTYLTYFMILYPVHFLACGAAAEKLGGNAKFRWPVVAVVAVLVAGNAVFMLDYYRFTAKFGGAQGTHGTGLGYKLAASRFLAEQGGARLQSECAAQLAQQPVQQPMFVELNHGGQAERPQLEWPLLIAQAAGAAPGRGTLLANTTVVLVDGNREALQPATWQQLDQLTKTNFGPIKIYFVKR